jgi:hypothetical protein
MTNLQQAIDGLHCPAIKILAFQQQPEQVMKRFRTLSNGQIAQNGVTDGMCLVSRPLYQVKYCLRFQV